MTTKQNNSIVQFTFSYDADQDGEYSKHRIDADQLVEIVTNMRELINRVDRTINRRKSTATLYLQAKTNSPEPVQSGSLELPFLLESSQNAIEIIKYIGILGGAGSGYAFGGFLSILDVIKKSKGKNILEVKTTDKSDEAILVLDGEEITSDKKIAKLISNSKVRENIQQIIAKPLEGKNLPTFKIKFFEPKLTDVDTNKKAETVYKEVETVKFDPNQVEIIENMEISLVPEIHTEEKETTIALTQISFIGSKKGWKMSYNGKTDISVELLDEFFIQKINRNAASFRKGDLFNVTLRITTRKTGKRETIQYSIVKVKNHMADQDRKIVSDQS